MVVFQPACHVCALVRQLDRACLAADRLSVGVTGFPLFFAENGGEVRKEAAVGTILCLAELTGEVVN